MSDEAYEIIRKYAENSGKSIYDSTNDAIQVFWGIYSIMGEGINAFLEEFQLYIMLKNLNGLRINTQTTPPSTLSIYLETYIRAKVSDEDRLSDETILTLTLLSQFLNCKATKTPKGEYIYMFENEEDAKYFEDLLNNLSVSLKIKLNINRDKKVVRVSFK
ncbi:hypothetical protein DDW09_00295 [Sulfolobus sp. SCGC AB-777_L09]|nr:hypothetical protein DDW09_00295 [Sulfolobus sp. SCGC AB-777_L09]